MRVRILLTIGYAAALGAWAYAEQKQGDLYSQGTYDALHSPAFELTFIVGLPILVGIVVRRAWVLLALVGPRLSLGYLQVSGYISPWHDGVDPLLSLPSFSIYTWLSLPLGLGVWLGRMRERWAAVLRRRLAGVRDG